jgi:ribonucleoside-diphosphate reductase alpha chain
MYENDTPVPSLGINAKAVVEKRYSLKDSEGRGTESWDAICRRVATAVAQAETDPDKRIIFANEAYDLMVERKFIPNTPCLVNAGTDDAQLAACFVLPVYDTMKDIMHHATACALIHKSGGGTGMSFERLRPAGAPVQGGSKGSASGPVSFMNIVNTVTDTVKQGGVRRGANMGILSITHPDILRFIHAKNNQTSLTNYNISVTITDKFLAAVESGDWFQLSFDGKPWDKVVYDPSAESEIYSYNGEIRPGMIHAPDIWNRIIASTHQFAEPGIIFIDNVNRNNTLLNTMGRILATNPCGEQALHDNNACNLGSIDVSKYFDPMADREFDLNSFTDDVMVAVRFLDNVIDVCKWPLPEIEATVKKTRPVGLGIMGLADLFLKKQIRYGSEECLKFTSWLFEWLRYSSWSESVALAQEKGALPDYEDNKDLFASLLASIGLNSNLKVRNYQTTCIAPTGTISLVAETSSGIEPNFAWAFVRRDTVSTRNYVHPLAAEALGIEVDYQDQESINKAAEYVAEHQNELPEWFVDAHGLSPEEHVRLLATCQKYIDNSISKTVNAPHDYSVEQTDEVHRLAWKLGCKAVSFYRDGSREGQVLTAVSSPKEEVPMPVSQGPGTETELVPAAPVNETATPVPANTSWGPGTAFGFAIPDQSVKETSFPMTADFSKTMTTNTLIPGSTITFSKSRASELTGSTFQIQFDGNKLYVTVNVADGKVAEAFVSGPISTVIGRLVSNMLAGGFPVEDIARSLDHEVGTHSVFFNKKLITSPEQAVAEVLRLMQRRLNGFPDAERDSATVAHSQGAISNSLGLSGTSLTPIVTFSGNSATVAHLEAKRCPECSGNIIVASGCEYCVCGYSKCK